ncbi:Glucooligosaccharide oxidase [Glonium stellatum]|uniref:Glucooligosaccharide oxidase n=1 Tax=Glonium stellatum TaxID=574774 RepID=A0A8E2F2W0_9PEZI|nr:Glucooligosaccharide oxidase [Glonium stellatum]
MVLISGLVLTLGLLAELAHADSNAQICLAKKNVPAIYPGSSAFVQAAETYNLRLQYTPAVVVNATTIQHISDAIVCADQNGLKVQAKSGGHSYASFSSGGKDGSMIINLENFNDISKSQNPSGVAVGAGVRVGNLALKLWEMGDLAVPHGTCPGIGVGGHFTHGGFGHTSRYWGLALDSVLAVDVVLPNGSYITADDKHYADIFWAARGAADSFGIATTFYLTTFNAPPSLVQFYYSFPIVWDNETIFADSLMHIQGFSQNASVVDSRLGFEIYIDSTYAFNIVGTFIGDMNEWTQKISLELLRGLPDFLEQNVTSMNYIESLISLADGESLQQPLHGYNLHENFFTKSITVPENSPVLHSTWMNYYNYIKNNTIGLQNGKWFSTIGLSGGPGSSVNGRNTTFAAYSDRSSLFVLQHNGIAASPTQSFPSSLQGFIQGMNDAIVKAQPETDFGASLVSADPSLSPEEAHELYYGKEVYARLLELKKEVDPKIIFWNPQAIGVGADINGYTTLNRRIEEDPCVECPCDSLNGPCQCVPNGCCCTKAERIAMEWNALERRAEALQADPCVECPCDGLNGPCTCVANGCCCTKAELQAMEALDRRTEQTQEDPCIECPCDGLNGPCSCVPNGCCCTRAEELAAEKAAMEKRTKEDPCVECPCDSLNGPCQCVPNGCCCTRAEELAFENAKEKRMEE